MPKTNWNKIKANCPKCGADHSLIEFWNAGPIIYILCPKCNYSLREDSEKGIFGVDGLLETWNSYKDID